MTWAAVAAAAATVVGGVMSNNANKKAAGAQAQAAQQGIGKIEGYYDESKQNLSPYMQTGGMANTGLQQLLGGDYSGFYNSPDFKAAMQAGGDMADNSAASRGMLFSGAHQKDLSNYGQQTAAQYLGNYRNFLGGTAGMGLGAATSLGGFGADAGRSIANLLGGAGDARASSLQANGMNNANSIGGLGSMFGSMFGNKGANGSGSTGGIFQNNTTTVPRNIGPYY